MSSYLISCLKRWSAAFSPPHGHPVKTDWTEKMSDSVSPLLITGPKNTTKTGRVEALEEVKTGRRLYTCQKYMYYESLTLCCSFTNPLVPHWSWCWPCLMVEWVRLHGHVIQANGRLTFGDDLGSGCLLCLTTQWNSVRTGLANSVVTLGEPGDC